MTLPDEAFKQDDVAELRERFSRLALIVRERTHRVGGCLCERCVEDEYQTAKVAAELRARVKQLEAELAKVRLAE